MKTFTIDTDNNISAFATPEEAAATTTLVCHFEQSREMERLGKPRHRRAGRRPSEREANESISEYLLRIVPAKPCVKRLASK